MLVKYNLLL